MDAFHPGRSGIICCPQAEERRQTFAEIADRKFFRVVGRRTVQPQLFPGKATEDMKRARPEEEMRAYKRNRDKEPESYGGCLLLAAAGVPEEDQEIVILTAQSAGLAFVSTPMRQLMTIEKSHVDLSTGLTPTLERVLQDLTVDGGAEPCYMGGDEFGQPSSFVRDRSGDF
jgi:hypothetical protein